MTEKTLTANRVLVVEDDANLVCLYTEALGLHGYTVDSAGTIDRARELLTSNTYAIFLCDVYIGKERSLDLLKDVLPTLDKTHVIMLSGTGQLYETAREMGIDFFLAKPINLPDLITLVQRLSLTSKKKPDSI